MPQPTGVHALVRRTHEERVLRVLRERGALSRGEIARHVGLSRTTLSEITNSLLARRAIVVVDTDAAERNGSGRPAERLALDPRSGQFMGVDFAHRRVTVAIADAAHEIIATGSERYGDDAEWPERLNLAFGLTDRLSEETGVHYGALQAIGIGIPFVTVDGVGPRRHQTPSVDVERAFATRFGASVLIDNNTRFAALAEAIEMPGGAAGDLVYVRLADGVGGGLVVGGRLVAGDAGVAGEFGHIRVASDGHACRCGKDGCLETIASVPQIIAECQARGVPVATLDDLGVEAARNHPIVVDVLRMVASVLARVLGSAVLTLNPSRVVIGGEVIRAVPTMLVYIRDALRYELFSADDVDELVRAAVLGDNDGALGAIAALFHQSPLLAGYPEPTPASPPSTDRKVAR